MTDAERRRAERTRSELAGTESAFGEIRAAMVKRLFETKPEDGAEHCSRTGFASLAALRAPRRE